jgi:arginine exporter protein ArgO
MGLAGLLALVPGWALPAGFAGGIFLLIAGLVHVSKRNKNPQEALATWTDLIVGVVIVALAVYVLVRALTG